MFGIEWFSDIRIWRFVMETYLNQGNQSAPGQPLMVYNSAMSGALLLVWLLMLFWLGKRRTGIIAGLLVAGAVIFWSDAKTPPLAIFIGSATLLFCLGTPSILRLGLAGAILALMYSAPLIPGQAPGENTICGEMPFLSHFALMRVRMWTNSTKHIFEVSIFGLGMNTSHSLYSPETKYRSNFLPPKSGGEVWHGTFEPIPLHPHNAILQIWLELGFVGITILAWIMVSLVRATQNRRGEPIVMAFYISVLTISSLSFGAWQNWWVCTVWLAAAMLAAQLPSRSKN